MTGTQLAVAPAAKGDIPYQLVKANPAEGKGAMQGITYIQRVALKGGVAPSAACTAADKGNYDDNGVQFPKGLDERFRAAFLDD